MEPHGTTARKLHPSERFSNLHILQYCDTPSALPNEDPRVVAFWLDGCLPLLLPAPSPLLGMGEKQKLSCAWVLLVSESECFVPPSLTRVDSEGTPTATIPAEV